MPVPVSQTLTLTTTLVPKEESNMPFIDDELLWCPDNDGKMVDLTQCLQVSRHLKASASADLHRNAEEPVVLVP